MSKIDNKLFQQKLKILLTKPAVIDGGLPLRENAFPCRDASSPRALDKVKQVFEHYWQKNQDIPYQADFEETYCKAFSAYHSGGFVDAVSSGSVAVYLALAVLDLPHGSKIGISPVTDPGAVSAVLLAGLVPIIVDSAPGDFNISADTLNAALISDPEIKATLLTHVGGIPLNMFDIMAVAKQHFVEVVEDCSQAHGAEVLGKKVGTFGRLAAFSTMFTKNHSTGSSGGVVLCSSEKDYWTLRSLADRQKPFSDPAFDPRDPGCFLGPGLNFNSNEIACALGSLSLGDLDETISKRQEKVNLMRDLLSQSSLFSLLTFPDNLKPSYFFCTLSITEKLSESEVNQLKDTLHQEGVSLNVNYKYVVSEWNWMKKLFPRMPLTTNASNFRKRSINVLFHEKYSDADMQDLALAILRAEFRMIKETDI
jgi:dTDP-4-amino-4,6-dideoxygalactose transaminase